MGPFFKISSAQYAHKYGVSIDLTKAYDTSTYYIPNENFNYEKIKLSQKSKEKLSRDDLDYLRNMKIM